MGESPDGQVECERYLMILFSPFRKMNGDFHHDCTKTPYHYQGLHVEYGVHAVYAASVRLSPNS